MEKESGGIGFVGVLQITFVYENGRKDAADDIMQIMRDNIKQVLEKEANG